MTAPTWNHAFLAVTGSVRLPAALLCPDLVIRVLTTPT
jgi:hypothetical protein